MGWGINGTQGTLGAEEEPGARQAGRALGWTAHPSAQALSPLTAALSHVSALRAPSGGPSAPRIHTAALSPPSPPGPSSRGVLGVPNLCPLLPHAKPGMLRRGRTLLPIAAQGRNHAASSHLRPTQCPLCAAASPPRRHALTSMPSAPGTPGGPGGPRGPGSPGGPRYGERRRGGASAGSSRTSGMLGVGVYCREHRPGALGQSERPKRASPSAPQQRYE